MPTKIVLDKREKGLIALFERDRADHETKQLDLGDVQILYSKEPFKTANFQATEAARKLLRTVSSTSEHAIDDEEKAEDACPILIERKSFTDLKASMADGRYHEQKSRYKQLPHGSVYYILENNDPKYEQLGWKQYLGAYVHTVVRDDIPVLLTGSIEETYKMIVKISEAIDEFGIVPGSTKVSAEASQIKKKKLSGKEVYKQQLCCFPGISSGKADAIAAVYPTITKLIDAISSGGFRVKGVGPVLVTKIKDGLCLEERDSGASLQFE